MPSAFYDTPAHPQDIEDCDRNITRSQIIMYTLRFIQQKTPNESQFHDPQYGKRTERDIEKVRDFFRYHELPFSRHTRHTNTIRSFQSDGAAPVTLDMIHKVLPAIKKKCIASQLTMCVDTVSTGLFTPITGMHM